MIEAMLMGAGMGVSIKSIQQVTRTLSNSSAVQFIDITGVDPSKTLIVGFVEIPPSVYWSAKALPGLYGSTAIKFSRFATGTSNTYASLKVIEFDKGVVVHRGTSSHPHGGEVVVSIPGIRNVDKCIPYGFQRRNFNSNSDTYTAYQMPVLSINSNGELVVRSMTYDGSTSGGTVDTEWQVVEFL